MSTASVPRCAPRGWIAPSDGEAAEMRPQRTQRAQRDEADKRKQSLLDMTPSIVGLLFCVSLCPLWSLIRCLTPAVPSASCPRGRCRSAGRRATSASCPRRCRGSGRRCARGPRPSARPRRARSRSRPTCRRSNPFLMPPPASTTENTFGQWSRPAVPLIFGVRPNSLEIMISVLSSSPRVVQVGDRAPRTPGRTAGAGSWCRRRCRCAGPTRRR